MERLAREFTLWRGGRMTGRWRADSRISDSWAAAAAEMAAEWWARAAGEVLLRPYAMVSVKPAAAPPRAHEYCCCEM